MIKGRARRSAVAVMLAGIVGCAGVGSGPATETGMLPARWTAADGRSEEVPFSFDAEGDSSGLLFTTLGAGGEHFRGNYVLLQQSTQGHLVTEVYDGWSTPEWNVWEKEPDGHWTAEAASYGGFAHFYTGRVVAYLPGSLGHAMRCRFTLKQPSGGFLAGGTGECQTSDRSAVDLSF